VGRGVLFIVSSSPPWGEEFHLFFLPLPCGERIEVRGKRKFLY